MLKLIKLIPPTFSILPLLVTYIYTDVVAAVVLDVYVNVDV